MTYVITVAKDAPIDKLCDELVEKIDDIGYDVDIEEREEPNCVRLYLDRVRVRTNLGYMKPNFDHWLSLNKAVNDVLDRENVSAEVKSSSFVVRTRSKRRITYVPGDYHGVDAEWKDVRHGS